jgi:hypothetical protein
MVTNWQLVDEQELPSGIQLDANTGAISGASSVSSSLNVSINASNSGNFYIVQFTLRVLPTAPLAVLYPSPVLVLSTGSSLTGVNVSDANGMQAPEIQFSVQPQLPPGLTLNSNTGDLQVTNATAASSIIKSSVLITIVATNTGGSANSTVQVVNPLPPDLIVYSTNPVACTVNRVMTSTEVIGAYPNARFSINPSLPTGLALDNNTGAITGTPLVVTENILYVVTVNTTASAVSFATLQLRVLPELPASLDFSTNVTLLIGTPVSQSFGPTADAAPFALKWSVAPPLPAGLSLNTTGYLTGNPAEISDWNTYTVAGSNAAGSVSTSFSLRVVERPPGSFTMSVNPVEVPVNSTMAPLTVVWAQQPLPGSQFLSFSVFPALPGGLSLDAKTGVISGKPTAVTDSKTYTIRAVNKLQPLLVSSTAFTLKVTGAVPVAPLERPFMYSFSDLVSVRSRLIRPRVSVLNEWLQSFQVGVPIESRFPLQGGIPLFSITPPLPSGVGFTIQTGQLAGTATAASPRRRYIVRNSIGQEFSFFLAVTDGGLSMTLRQMTVG